MGYGSSENKDLREDIVYLSAGIHNNVSIDKVVFGNKSTRNGDKQVIEVFFKGDDGVFVHTEWDSGDDDKKIANQLLRLRRFVKEATGVDSFGSTFDSWEDCGNKFVAAMANTSASKYQIKLLYNAAGYTEMPKYDSAIRNMANPTLVLSAEEQKKVVKVTASTAVPEDPNINEATF